MPRVPPPCFRRKQLGRHIRFAWRAVAARTYIPQVGYLIVFWYAACTRKESTARHSGTAAKQCKMKPKISGRKTNPRPSPKLIFCLIGTPCTGQKRKTMNSRASLSASYAAHPSRNHLATDSVRVKLSSLSATAPSHASREARCSPWPSFASSAVLVFKLGAPSFNFSVVAKISTDIVLQFRTTLISRTYSVQNHKLRPDRAHSCCPRVSRHTRRLGTKAATTLLATPPLPVSSR